MAAFTGIHLSLTVCDKGAVVLREHLLHLRAAGGWVPLTALARPRASLPPPDRASASLSFFSGGELRGTVTSFQARASAAGALQLLHTPPGRASPTVELTLHTPPGCVPGRYEAFVYGRLDDAFVYDTIL